MKFPLKNGSRGNEVGIVQQYLNVQLRKQGKAEIKVDNAFGPITERILQSLTGAREVSQALFNTIRKFLANHFSNRSNSGSGLDLKNMSGDQVVTWLSENDMKLQHALLALRELITRIKQKGVSVASLEAQLAQLANSYNRRQGKLSTDSFISANKGIGKAYKWLRDAWDEAVGGAPLVPIAAAVIVVGFTVTGTVLYYRYQQDARDSEEELRRKIPALEAAAKKLDKQEFDQLIKQIQDHGASKFNAGQFGSFGGIVKAGAYFFVGVTVVKIISNINVKRRK